MNTITAMRGEQMHVRTVTVAIPKAERSALAVWFQAVRFHFVPPSFLPAILGGVIAWVRHGVFDCGGFSLVLAGVTICHFGINMIDDVFDYLHAVDSLGDKNPFSGGSGVITDGLLSVRQVAAGAVVCFTITALIGVYLAATRGWPLVMFGLFGMFCAVFYAAPPIKFGYRGLGECAMIVNFGPLIGMGAYYVQTRQFSFEPFLVSLILGFMMWSMLVINEIPDYEADRHGGKWNLVARFGRRAGIRFYIGGLIVAYAVLVAAALTVSPPYVLLGLVSIPLAYRSVRILRQHYCDPLTMAPANATMIKVHMATGVALIVGYLLARFL